MKKIIIIYFLLFCAKITLSQDTISFSLPNNGNYSVMEFDSLSGIWLQKEFFNNFLFSIEKLSSDKFHPIENYTGYFSDGSISFIRTHHFNGKFTELHGEKIINYSNGNLKEKGQYCHGIKYGDWEFYNHDGQIKQLTQFNVFLIDTITAMSSITDFQKNLSLDTLTSDADFTFYAYFPIVCFGKNGLEIIYKNNKPIELKKYKFGELIKVEKRKWKIKKILKYGISF